MWEFDQVTGFCSALILYNRELLVLLQRTGNPQQGANAEVPLPFRHMARFRRTTEEFGLEMSVLSAVYITRDAYLVCLSHALTTEREEVMGLLLGDVKVHKIFNIFALKVDNLPFRKDQKGRSHLCGRFPF